MRIKLSVGIFFMPIIAVAQSNVILNFQNGPTITLPTGANQSALALADFNTDGKGDIAVCQRGLNSIGIYLQTASGTFPAAPNSTYPAGNAPSGLVATSLSNLSGHPYYDLVAISGPSSRWTVLSNTGNKQGTFTSATKTFGTGSISTNPQLATAYLNGDNYPDFAYTYDPPGKEELVWTGYFGGTNFNNGNGTVPGFAPPSFTIADFDNDGYLDVTYPKPSTNQFRVLFSSPGNNNSTDWSAPNELLTLSGTSTQPVYIAAGDVNSDSKQDLAVANAGSSDIAVWLNTSTFQFGSTSVYPLSAAPRQARLADLNGDGKPELITITADNKLQLFRHTGASGYARYGTPVQLATGTDPTLLQLADMDGDGVRDIVVGCSGDNSTLR